MAHAQIKAGGPTRGRRRVKKVGMNSAKSRAKAKASTKGKRG